MQESFYDADHLCEHLIPADSFYRKLREIVAPLIKDEHFDTMYCKDNGRPSIPPALLAMATILQFYRNLSDREMERACMYDIEVKYALGLRLDERPFDHSSLGDFRKRLLENGKEKEVFDSILNHLVTAGLIKKNEIQRIDATHVIADIAMPTMIRLVKKSIFEILKPLKSRYKEAYERIATEIDLTEYTRETVNNEGGVRPDPEKKKRKLVEVVNDARAVLRHTRAVGDRDIRRKKDMLRRILQENLEKDEDGEVKEKIHGDKPNDVLISPIDPDARFGRKSKTNKFFGYKANVTEAVDSRFITNIVAMPGNRQDGKTAVEAIAEQKEIGLIPLKLIGDTAYGDGLNRKLLKEHGTEMVAPLCVIRNPRTAGIFPKSMFECNEKKNTLTCPQGITVSQSYFDYQKDIKIFHFPMSKCNKCAVQSQCTRERNGRRSVGISTVNTELRDAERYNQTEQFKEDMKLRSPIEGKLSELVRYHGLRRARYRGLKKVGLQFYFTAAAVNIKRWIKVLMDKMKPDIPQLAVS
ncbi:MAG TPA: IS1182 family transposase [Nitrospiraceae bacterium]|nr:IS1182 family transposase [Nitrospiraceae bacterium]